MPKPKQYILNIGDRFGNLTVLEPELKIQNRRYAKCICDCGKETNGLIYQLVNGHTTSCGCKCGLIQLSKYKIGTKIGMLTIIGYAGHSKGHRKVKVKCECGTIKIINLRSDTKSCGCIIGKGKHPAESEYNRYKRHCERHGKKFELTLEEYMELVFGECYYCGDPPNMKMHSGKLLRNGIDRLDNTIHYIANNCVTACGKCNFAKRALGVKDFLEMIQKIYKKHF